MPQLDPTWFASQLFWLAVTFVALYFILSRLVLPPLLDIMARRGQTVAGDIQQAESLTSQAEHARQHYELTMADARERAQGLMNDAILEQKSRAEQQAKAMDAQVEHKLADASKQIAAKKAELTQALTPTASELTGLIIEKLTQNRANADQINRIIGELSKERS